MDLPEEKGTYVLIASVLQMKRIGRLGEFDIVPGFYAYVGSPTRITATFNSRRNRRSSGDQLSTRFRKA